ncbi:MAG: hypothetical protein HY974_03210 [Candidatus Kerfeldbacteria bacterium]|nr:hypothetical protein [Candidatus Kerfeldbacteria bacterium]
MCRLNVALLGLFVVWGFAVGHSQSNSLPHSAVVVTSTYTNTMEAPFFSKAWIWIIFASPSKFTLYENSWPTGGLDGFSIRLVDDKGVTWVELYSDTLKPSIVQLPSDSLKHLAADGIAFVGSLRRLFADSTRHTLKARVTLGGARMFVSVKEIESQAPQTRRFTVRTFDQQGKTYVNGQVQVGQQNNLVSYQSISVFVHKGKIQLKLEIIDHQVKTTN